MKRWRLRGDCCYLMIELVHLSVQVREGAFGVDVMKSRREGHRHLG